MTLKSHPDVCLADVAEVMLMAARAAMVMNELRMQGLLDKMRPASSRKENQS